MTLENFITLLLSNITLKHILILMLIWDVFQYFNLYKNWIKDFIINTKNCANGKGNYNEPYEQINSVRFFIAWANPNGIDPNTGLTNRLTAINKLKFFDCFYKFIDGPVYFYEYAIISNGNNRTYYLNLCDKQKIIFRWLDELCIKYLIQIIRYFRYIKPPSNRQYYLKFYKPKHRIITFFIEIKKKMKAKKLWKKHNKQWKIKNQINYNKFWGYK